MIAANLNIVHAVPCSLAYIYILQSVSVGAILSLSLSLKEKGLGMAGVKFIVRSSEGDEKSFDLKLETNTVADLKTEVARAFDVKAEEQRLSYGGLEWRWRMTRNSAFTVLISFSSLSISNYLYI